MGERQGHEGCRGRALTCSAVHGMAARTSGEQRTLALHRKLAASSTCCFLLLVQAHSSTDRKHQQVFVEPSAAAPRPSNHKLCGAQRGARKRHSAAMVLLVFDQNWYAVQWTRNLRGSLIIRSLEVRRSCLWRR